ncbi:MAG: ParB/RepB/Spo0J family partition protein [Candidatus Scatosoma sp.]
MKKRTKKLSAEALKNPALAAAAETLKRNTAGAVETARAEKALADKGYTQEAIACFAGKSRSAVANDLRLLTLEADVLALVEQGKLSAGHARALVNAPKEKQLPFALETVKGGYSVRQTERAVKIFLTPPEVLRAEKSAAAAEQNQRLRAAVESMRAALGLKVSLVGTAKKGRVYIDYLSEADLSRLQRCLESAARADEKNTKR